MEEGKSLDVPRQKICLEDFRESQPLDNNGSIDMEDLHKKIVDEILPRLAEKLKQEGIILDHDNKQIKIENLLELRIDRPAGDTLTRVTRQRSSA
jgi:hypothetical protein